MVSAVKKALPIFWFVSSSHVKHLYVLTRCSSHFTMLGIWHHDQPTLLYHIEVNSSRKKMDCVKEEDDTLNNNHSTWTNQGQMTLSFSAWQEFVNQAKAHLALIQKGELDGNLPIMQKLNWPWSVEGREPVYVLPLFLSWSRFLNKSTSWNELHYQTAWFSEYTFMG